MAEKVIVKAEVREGRGKEDSKKMRREGRIPIVVYGAGKDSIAASVALSDLAAILRTEGGNNSVFTLDVAGEGPSDVIFQDRQIDALKGRLLHADLRRFAIGEKIELTVAIHLVGHAVGLNEEGAMLVQPLREIKVLCEPANAPEAFEVDVTELKLGESLHVSDLKVPAGAEIHEAPETVVVSVNFTAEPVLESAVEEGAQPVVEGEVKAPEGGE